MRKDYFGIKSSRKNLNRKHLTSMLFFVLLFVFTSQNIFAQGDIFTAATPATNPMDPNGDGFITTTGGLFTGAPTLEESEFEITYIELPNFGTEPNGDLQTGSACGATEIVENTANSSNGSYYYIYDPDGTPDNGDELMLFRMRIAQDPSGAFGYSFLLDTDNLFGFAGATADPNAIAGNPGFEIEISLGIQGGGAGVKVFNVDGTTSGTSINTYPLSSNYQRVNALDNDPGCGPGAIFFDFYVPLTDVIPLVSSPFRVVAATSSSASSALGGSASDISGLDGNLPAFLNNDDAQFEAAISAYAAAAGPEIDVLGNAISIIGDGTNTPNLADGTDFGQVTTLTSSPEQLFTIENTGTSDLTLNPSFTSNPAFSITTAAVSPVVAGGSTTIGITFTAPVALGVVNAQLFISNNDADEGPAYEINLRGESTAVGPEIDVLGNTISIIGNGTNTPNIADGTDFGQIVTGTSSAEQFFTIENTGTLPLSVGPSFTTNIPVFSITTLPVSPVPAGGSTTIGITFNAPGSLGVENAQLFITNNDPDEQPVYTINLQGESVPPPPEIDVLGNGISIVGDGTNVPNLGDGTDFGSIAQGTASFERFFTIQNTGLGPLSVNPSFSSDPNFAITSLPTSPVPAGGSTTIGITFNAPATLGAQTATIFITNDDSDENPYQINLSGTSIIDTDGDGIADISDLDDDNDGILDTVEGVVDTDSDGVINSLDLDSDNDGIADLVETGEADADNNGIIDGFTDIDGNGFDDALENPELYPQDNAASTFTEVNGIGGWNDVASLACDVTVSTTEFYDGTYSLKFTSDGSNNWQWADLPLTLADATQYEITLWYKLGVNVANASEFTNWVGFTSTPNEVISSTSWEKKTYTLTTNSANQIIRVYATSGSTQAGEEVFIDRVSIRETLVQTLQDTDLDGTPDYLDLDSDNDGCFDSLEGAGGYTLADLNIDGSLSAPVNLQGVPGGSLQATTANVTDSNVISPVCDADSDGVTYSIDLDDDNDGITDIVEGAGDQDGDGIINALDLDSDNDGIMDVVETGNPDADGNGIIDGFTDLDSNGLHDGIENPDLYPQDNAASTFTEVNGIGGWNDVASLACDVTVSTTEFYDGTYSLKFTSDGSNNWQWADLPLTLADATQYEITLWYKLGVNVANASEFTNWVGFTSTPNEVISSTSWEKKTYTLTTNSANQIIRVYATSGSTQAGEEVYIDKISIKETLVQILPNNDIDALVDYLDLDSDNDGIPDNIEAQTTLGYIAPDGVFDTNGLDTAYPAGLTPIDTDSDSIPDYLDLDSDNEGADDTTEAALVLSGTVGANGLDNNYDSTDDYLDVNGSFDDTQSDNFPDSDNDITFGGDVDFRDAFFAPDKDGDGVPDIGDLDDDNDGIPDVAETGGQDPSVDGDGDNVPFYLDDDDANPAVGDDDGLIQPGFDLDGDLIANHLDLDADNDGIFDLHEAGHTELDADFNGEIDGVPADFGANGLFNAIESDDTQAATITYTLFDSDGDVTIDALDVDDDNDGVNTTFEVDNTDLDGDPTTGVVIDSDLDTTLDYLDIDDDGDGVNTIFEVDNADLDGDPSTGVVIDTDSDTTLDYLDTDDDGDGVNTILEVDNADLDGDPTTGVVIDTDLDTILDYLDADDDGDSINTEFEVDNADADGDPTTGVVIDSDADTILNYLDPDDDGDGINTINENPDPNGDGDPLDAEDKDGDGIPNYLDLDSDNDGILDSVELALDTDGDGVENYIDLDSDNDGIFDVVEAGLDAFDSNFDGVIDTLISVGVNGLFDALETFPDSGILNPIYDPIDSTTAAGVPAPDGIFDFLELDSDTDGCNDVTEAGYTDGDSDGLLGTSPVATDANGLVTSAIDGYTIPNDTDVNGTFDFQEYSETTSITTQPVTPPPTIAGGTVNIDITSNANTFQWEVSTTGVGGPYTPIANDANYSGVATANLTISNIPLSFDGYFYRVQLSTNNFLCDVPLISDAVEVTVLQDNDGDGIPDITDLDDDNDGIPDVDEDAGGVPVDVDGDGVPNSLDLDSDNDGIYDLVESGQIDAANNVVDVNNDGIIDAANAGTVGANGIFDPLENAPDSGVLTNATADSDTDGIVDSNEINADDDGCNDVIEAGFTDPDANGYLGNGTPGAGLVTDANGVVTGQGGYTTPDDNDSNGTYDFQEPGEQVVLSSQPLSQVVVINATANFDVTGTSPVYTWYESTDGGIIWNVMTNGGTNPTVTGANTDTLTLTNVPGSYDGNQYRVVLSSPAYACGGNITSNSALLTVYADFDGDGIGDPVDLDDDNDGIPDTVETGGIDPTSDNDGDGVPVYLDDNDNNISVGNDNGMVEPAFDFDGDGLANHLELDSDNDGVYDTNEAGFADLDLDNNGVVDGIPADFGANGLLDSLETAPESGLINYTPLDTDSDTRLNFIDRDDDADGVNTQFENPDADSNGDPSDAQDTDSDGTPDYLDIDDDADGVYTSFEGVNPDGDGNPNTGSTRDTDNDTVFNYLDIDDDGDSVNTVFEGVNPDGDGNPNTGATLNTDGDSLLNYLDTDDDGDSIPTIFENPDANNDGDPADAQDTDGDLIPDYLDNDDDDDTILTFFENPDPDGNGDPLDAQDSDGNGVPDYLDNDDDGDGVLTELENPDPNGNGNPADAQDTDGDGTPDYLDVDDDGDGILTLDEDVDGDGDPTNDDSDADGVPNYLDIDDDNDGIITLTEGPGNVDSDSYPNYLDQDADGDGIPDNVEGQLTLGYVLPAGDSDGNGLDDAYEATPGSGGGIIPVNTDGADNPDYLDSDSDNDNVPDSIEGHNFLAQFDPDVLPSGNDVDGDGLDDAYDGAVGSFLDPNGLIVIDNPATDLPNFDSTDEVNFRDTDDDNDGINTIDEDGDLSGDPIYDDCDEDGNPDYVDIIPCDRIPTGFSPNDDGNNDTLVVPALAQYKDFTMEVYDRWGNIVYEYNNNGREQPLWWDGFSTGTRTINKGEKVPVGTYFYVIEFNQDRIPPRTGWVYVNY